MQSTKSYCTDSRIRLGTGAYRRYVTFPFPASPHSLRKVRIRLVVPSMSNNTAGAILWSIVIEHRKDPGMNVVVTSVERWLVAYLVMVAGFFGSSQTSSTTVLHVRSITISHLSTTTSSHTVSNSYTVQLNELHTVSMWLKTHRTSLYRFHSYIQSTYGQQWSSSLICGIGSQRVKLQALK